MAPLVQEDVCRFAVNQSYGGRPVVNVIDMAITDIDSGTRAEACEDQARDILNAWADRILPAQVAQLSFNSVSWVDINTIDGSTGVVTTGADEVLPQPGGSATAGLPGNVAGLITKIAPGGGRRTRNGLLFLAGLSEAVTVIGVPNQIEPATVTSLTTRFEGFSSDISNGLLEGNYQSNMVVLHTTRVPDPEDPTKTIQVATGYSLVDAMACQATLATQRDRLRG